MIIPCDLADSDDKLDNTFFFCASPVTFIRSNKSLRKQNEYTLHASDCTWPLRYYMFLVVLNQYESSHANYCRNANVRLIENTSFGSPAEPEPLPPVLRRLATFATGPCILVWVIVLKLETEVVAQTSKHVRNYVASRHWLLISVSNSVCINVCFLCTTWPPETCNGGIPGEKRAPCPSEMASNMPPIATALAPSMEVDVSSAMTSELQ